MSERLFYQLVADGLLVLHGLFVAFVVFGLMLVIAGWLAGWRWTRNLWFRLLHLGAIAFVTVQAWLGMICPLTTWEMAFRERAGDVVYAGSFIEYWLHRLIFYQAEPWVFTLAYTLFGLAVVGGWILHPPRFRSASSRGGGP